MIVMKFGGSSVGSAEAMRQVASIVARYRSERPIVVVSALQGVTDALLSGAKKKSGGDGIRARHLEVLEALGAEDARSEVETLLDECRAALAEADASEIGTMDHVVSFGERLSAPLVAAALRQAGVPARAVDARELIITDDLFGSAEVDFEASAARIRPALTQLVEGGLVPVVTGFIGATPRGETTTIGRGGSDYTAAILGGLLPAREIWIWKEVDGIMSADPRIVPEAAVLSDMSYDEAAEISHFGAKVLHPKTMIPAARADVPIRMRNTFRPEAPGTSIGPVSSPTPRGVKVVTAVKKLAIVSVEGKGMAGIAGFAAYVFGAAGRRRINIVMFSQSSAEQVICLVVPADEARRLQKALEEDLAQAVSSHLVDAIRVDEGVAAVAVVGDGMRGRSGIAADVFAAVAKEGASVLAIAQGSSERNISFIVREHEADAVVRAVHQAFL